MSRQLNVILRQLDMSNADIFRACSESSQGPGGASTASRSPPSGRSGRVEDSESTAVMLMAFTIKFAFKVLPCSCPH